jgi:hypothetical protein
MATSSEQSPQLEAPRFSGRTNSNGFNGSPPSPTSPRYSSSSTPRRSMAGNGNSKILGSIDENGGMSPDIPIRSPHRPQPSASTYVKPRTFLNNFFSPPKDDLEDIKGPHGEKFSDVRSNRRSDSNSDEMRGRKRNILRRGGWRTMVCLGLVLFIIAALVAIGLVVGLKRMKSGHRYALSYAEYAWSSHVGSFAPIFPRWRSLSSAEMQGKSISVLH